jgi:predicted MPP superfamily phosphohydrolase
MRWKKRLGKLILFLAVIVLAAAAVLAALMQTNGKLDFEESFYQIQSDKLTSNVRVVLLSDLHLREFGTKNCELTERIWELQPDLIAITGDMNRKDVDDYQVVIDLCEALVDIAPVYYSVGNHEWPKIVLEGSSIGDDIRDTGVHLLTDQSETIEVNGNTIKIGGLAEAPQQYEKYGKDFFESFEQGDEFKLLLVHYPEYFLGVLDDADIDVAMCGHAHGGQVRIPGIGGLYTKDQGLFPELTEGVQKVNDISVVVSRGLGDSSNVPRINNPPELVVVDMNWY